MKPMLFVNATIGFSQNLFPVNPSYSMVILTRSALMIVLCKTNKMDTDEILYEVDVLGHTVRMTYEQKVTIVIVSK